MIFGNKREPKKLVDLVELAVKKGNLPMEAKYVPGTSYHGPYVSVSVAGISFCTMSIDEMAKKHIGYRKPEDFKYGSTSHIAQEIIFKLEKFELAEGSRNVTDTITDSSSHMRGRDLSDISLALKSTIAKVADKRDKKEYWAAVDKLDDIVSEKFEEESYMR